jgi:hypothetical protein
MRNKFQHITIHFVLALVLSYFLATLFFIHTHSVNGIKFSHSHPFSKEHQHTPNELIVLNVLTHFVWVGMGLISIISLPSSLFERPLLMRVSNLQKSFSIQGISLRAPPLDY